MYETNLVLAKQFLNLHQRTASAPCSLDILADDIVYDLIIGQPDPVIWPMRGKKEVGSYLSSLPANYQIQGRQQREEFVTNEQIVIVGSEVASLVKMDQVVSAEWTAVLKVKGGRIQRVTMTVYRRPVDVNEKPANRSPVRADNVKKAKHWLSF